MNNINYKICRHHSCEHKQIKQSVENFYRWKHSKDGFGHVCKDCSNKIRLARSKKNKSLEIDPKENFRLCTANRCRQKDKNLPLSAFFKDSKSPLGYGNTCKECENIRWQKRKNDPIAMEKKLVADKKWRINNREKKLINDRRYHAEFGKEIYQRDKEKLQERQKLWAKNNRSSINKRRNNKLANDPQYKLTEKLRIRIYHALKGKSKVGSAVKDLGCDGEFLKKFIEKKFYQHPVTGEKMCWANWNHAGWHLDHIVPLSLFDLTDRKQFLEANHYSNLQPLWAEENYLKSNNI